MSEPRKVYAGIGSRRTPPDILAVMKQLGLILAAQGWVLRTGGAPGADSAFMDGCLKHPIPVGEPRQHELYLPWPTFGASPAIPKLERPTRLAYDIAADYHPHWPHLKRTTKALMARNVHQVLGADLDDPVRMIVCWTPDGSLDGHGPDSGGTGMALRIAAGRCPNTNVYNLCRSEHLARVQRLCTEVDS